LREMLSCPGRPGERFITIIDEKGQMLSANASMRRGLEIADPKNVAVNFFDLVHPSHLGVLKQTISKVNLTREFGQVELYIRNGYYHPMKWKVAVLEDTNAATKQYLCTGYKIVDEERVKQLDTLLRNNYQLIIEGTSGLMFHDINGELIAANRKTASIFGISLEAVYSLKNIEALWNETWSICDEDDRPVKFNDTPIMKALRTGLSQTQTLGIRLSSGDTKWILYNSQPLVKYQGGEPYAVVTNIVDVSSERRLSREVNETKALIDAFFKQTPALAWVIDEEARLYFGSHAFFKHFRLQERESIGRKITDLIPPSVSKTLAEKHIEVFETGQPVQTTEKVGWADGTYTISHINLFPLRSLSGTSLVGGQAVRLPDKSRLEKELKEAHERMLTLNRATTDAIWDWDMKTGQIYRNERCMEMIGYQLDNSKGLSWWLRRIHPEDRNRLADKIKEATDNMQQSWQDEYRFKCADGRYKYVEDRGFVVYENGLPVKMIGSLQDKSEVKELESELADVRLQKQKEISETVIRVQEKERTRIGHELHDNVNQILSTVKLFFDRIAPGGTEQKHLKDKSIEYLQLAIDEIRKLSKELVTPQLKKETLAATIQAIIMDIQMTGALQISFTHDIDDQLLSPGKKVTLFRIVQEQLKNILKHSQATKTEISLRTDAEHIRLEIKDNGKGFDPQQTRQGIGLANIHERTQFYQGTANIAAAGGKGCVLTVTIPIKE
jgi:PAS domain S-box-containing protein